MNIIKRLLLFCIVMITTACFNVVKSNEDETVAKACVEDNKWYLPSSGQELQNPNEYLQNITGDNILLLGEHHDRSEHHRWQLHAIITLYAYNQKMKLGFEMFPRNVQPILDAWVKGEIEEDEFLKKVKWERNWNYDSKLYMPIFHFARMNSIPMVALNVDRNLVRLVRDKGWENVPEAEREDVTDPAPMSEAYLSYMEDIFKQHFRNGLTGDNSQSEQDKIADAGSKESVRENPKFRRFIQGQQLWDAAMAQKLAQNLDKDHLVVGIMGSGHITNGYGVPGQLRSMNINNFKMLVPWHNQFNCSDLKPGFSDVVVGVARSDKPKQVKIKPRLGIYMAKHDEGVLITRIIDESVAEKTGLMADDIVVSMAGAPIKKMSEVIEIVQNMVFGTWLPISVKRKDQTLDFIAKFPKNSHPRN